MKIFKYIISLLFFGIVIFMMLWTMDQSNVLDIDFSFLNNLDFMQNIINTKNDNPLTFSLTFYSIIGLLTITSVFGILSTSKKRGVRITSVIFMWMSLILAICLLVFGILLIVYK